MDVQFSVGIRHGEQGLLNGWIGDLALRQDAPGDECPLIQTLRRICPPRTQKGPIGERSGEAHPFEDQPGFFSGIFIQQLVAEDQVRLVLDGQRGRCIARDLAATVQRFTAILLLSFLDRRDPEVVAGKPFQLLDLLQIPEGLCRFGEAPVCHENLAAQEFHIIPDRCRDGAANPFQGMVGLFRLVFLEVEPCQAVNRVVAHRLLHVPLDDRGHGAPGLTVHPVAQLEIPDTELRLVDVVMERVQARFIEPAVLPQFGVEPGDGLKPVPLKGVIERLAEVDILLPFRHVGVGCQ